MYVDFFFKLCNTNERTLLLRDILIFILAIKTFDTSERLQRRSETEKLLVSMLLNKIVYVSMTIEVIGKFTFVYANSRRGRIKFVTLFKY